jgi:hypothetical protein
VHDDRIAAARAVRWCETAGLMECSRPHGRRIRSFRRDDLLEQPAAGDQRGLELLMVEDRTFDVRERPGSGCTVATNHHQQSAGREAQARNDEGVAPASEHPR